MKIIIIRHGKTLANLLNENGTIFYTGALDSEITNLSEEGIESAKKLQYNFEIQKIQKIYCSGLNRAIRTAHLLNLPCPIIVDERLNERSLGVFEGKMQTDMLNSSYQKYLTDDNYNKFRTDFKQKAPEGENYEDVYNRCRQFLNDLPVDQDITIGIVSHLNTIRCLLLILLNINPKEKIFDIKVEHATPYILEGKELGKFKMLK